MHGWIACPNPPLLGRCHRSSRQEKFIMMKLIETLYTLTIFTMPPKKNEPKEESKKEEVPKSISQPT